MAKSTPCIDRSGFLAGESSGSARDRRGIRPIVTLLESCNNYMENKMNIARSVIAMYVVAWLRLACAAAQETAGPTWPDYLQDCGLKAIDANEARSVAAFEAKYKGKTIHWTGRVDTTKDGWWGKYDMYVLMNPTESTFTKSDLQITIPKGFKDLVLSLNKGDDIVFDGTIDTQGAHFQHHMIIVTNLARPGVQAPAERPPAEEPQKTVPTTNQDGLEAARKSLIGTWTYTKPGIVLWSKWVIKDDGTLDFYTAQSNYRDWGTATSFKWMSITDKDPVTGDTIYGIQPVRNVADHMPKMLACKDGLGRLVVKVGAVDPDHPEFITMECGDKFPFVKLTDTNVDSIMNGALDEFAASLREMFGIPKATGNEPPLTPAQSERLEAIITKSQSHDLENFGTPAESKEIKTRKMIIFHKYRHDALKDAILVKPIDERDAAIVRLREASKEKPAEPTSTVLPPTKATDAAELEGKVAIAEHKHHESIKQGTTPLETIESLNRKMAKVAGETYKVDGDDYYIVNIMNNQSVVIHASPGRPMPPQFHRLNEPNNFFIDALFKFMRNTEGTNGYGAKIMIEVYEPYTDEEILQIAPHSWQGAAAGAKAAKTVKQPTVTGPVVAPVTDRDQDDITRRIAAAKAEYRANHPEHGYQATPAVDQAHETRKARAAYLISYIIETGNEIDQLNANGRNPRNYWRAIVDAQNELLNIYRVELSGNTDLDCIRILKSNIARLTRGREFAWDSIRKSH